MQEMVVPKCFELQFDTDLIEKSRFRSVILLSTNATRPSKFQPLSL
jgi:hypothetical protein